MLVALSMLGHVHTDGHVPRCARWASQQVDGVCIARLTPHRLEYQAQVELSGRVIGMRGGLISLCVHSPGKPALWCG